MKVDTEEVTNVEKDNHGQAIRLGAPTSYVEDHPMYCKWPLTRKYSL